MKDSLKKQCTIGCSHDKCIFCGIYKDKKFRVRAVDEIMAAIAAEKHGDLEKVFL